jgi:hypothetical protein
MPCTVRTIVRGAALIVVAALIASCGALPTPGAPPASTVTARPVAATAQPSPTLPPAAPSAPMPAAATPTSTPAPFPTLVPTPTPTPLAAATATLVASLTNQIKPTLPTPNPTPGPGNMSIYVYPLQSPWGDALFAAQTTGFRSLTPLIDHTIEIYKYTGSGWQSLGKVGLDCPDYLSPGSSKQVQVEPSRIWIAVDGGAGAHSGCFDLLSFDGKALEREASNVNSFQGNGRVQDLNGDGLGDVILDHTDPYVFCYACGVRYASFEVQRWDGSKLVDVALTALPQTATAAVRDSNNDAVTLAEGGLWKDAQQAISQALALAPQDQTVVWNNALIQLTADAQAANITGGYPLLGYAFYGDYDAAVNLMRPYPPEQIFITTTPLISGTIAQGWESSLTQWITQTTTASLLVKPDLASAYFLRAWGNFLTNPANPTIVADVAKAAELAPNDGLYASSLAYLKRK